MRILFDAFDTGVTPIVPPSGPDGILLGTGVEFEQGAKHVVEYFTDIHKSWNGLERRARLLSGPRDRLEAEVVVVDESVFRDLRRRRAFDLDDIYLIPTRYEQATLLSEISGTSFTLDATYLDWLSPGQRILIESPAGAYDAVIQTAGSGPGTATVTVDEAAPAGNFPAFATTCTPLRPFYLESPSAVGRYQVGAGSWSVVARGYRPRTVIGTGATVSTLDGLNILSVRPIVHDLGAEDRPEGGLEMHDYGMVVLPEWSRTVADIFRGHEYRINSSADRAFWWKFLDTVKGCQKAFLLPTWRDDFVPLAGSESGNQVDFDDGGAYASSWFSDTTHRRFWVTESTGNVLFRTATAASVVSSRSRVTFNDSVSANPTTSYMFLELVRLASDAIEFTYEAGCFGTVEPRFLVVRQ